MKLSENQVQRIILDHVNSKTCCCLFRVNNTGKRGLRKSTLPLGFSDLAGYIWVGGYIYPLYVEVKAEGLKCTDENQIAFLKERKNDGCIAFWCDSLEMFKRKLYCRFLDLLVHDGR